MNTMLSVLAVAFFLIATAVAEENHPHAQFYNPVSLGIYYPGEWGEITANPNGRIVEAIEGGYEVSFSKVDGTKFIPMEGNQTCSECMEFQKSYARPY
jgi:hypothetical protein